MTDLDVAATKLNRATKTSGKLAQTGGTLVPEPQLGVGKIQFIRGMTAALFNGIFGLAAPAVGRSLESGEVTISWLAPDEWLLTGSEAIVLAALDLAGKAGDGALALDLTHGRTSFRLSGMDARDRLAAHTPLDISDAAMAIGQVARAPLGDTTMFLARLPDIGGQASFRIIVDQTMGAYATRMLADPTAVPGATL